MVHRQGARKHKAWKIDSVKYSKSWSLLSYYLKGLITGQAFTNQTTQQRTYKEGLPQRQKVLYLHTQVAGVRAFASLFTVVRKTRDNQLCLRVERISRKKVLQKDLTGTRFQIFSKCIHFGALKTPSPNDFIHERPSIKQD